MAPMSCRISSAAMVCGADAALGEGDILRNRRIEVMAHHRHVEMLVEGVDRVGIGRIGRRRQAIRLAGDADDVRRMAAAGALGVVHVDGAAADRGKRILEEAALIQRVGMDLDLKVELVGDRRQVSITAGIEPQSSCSLRPMQPALDLLDDRRGLAMSCRAREIRN